MKAFPPALILCLFSFFSAESSAQSPDTPAVNILSMGDWGMNNPTQRTVARTLSTYIPASHRTFSGIFLLGDNFYVPLAGVNDPLWQTMFEKMYDSRALSFPFYAALGNHDYKNKEVDF